MNNISKLNFDKINEIAYASEDFIVKELLKYLSSEYNKRLHNNKERAEEIVINARKSIGIIKNPIDSLLLEY